MTAAQITKELEQQTLIHDTARKMVELVDEAASGVAKLGGDGDAAREKILELVNEE